MRSPSASRIPSLDGLRAVAIGFVIAAHTGILLLPRGAGGAKVYKIFHTVELGSLGVRMFFVLSGFLITGMLLRELDRTGTLRLRTFYWRRTLRIFPAYYVMVALTVVSFALGWQVVRASNVWAAALYLSDYIPQLNWPLRHTWSLAVEEQFYLIWPFALLVLGRRGGLWLAAAVCLVAPLIRLAWYPSHPFGQPGLDIGYTFETVFDSLATGCLLAGLRDLLWKRRWYRRFLASPVFVLVPLGALAVASVHDRPRLMYLVGYGVMNVAIALTVDQVVRFPCTWAGKALNSVGMVWLGTLSYSLYLWQQAFLNPRGALATLPIPILLAMILAAACASYYAVERPILAWRDQRSRSAPPTRDAIAA